MARFVAGLATLAVILASCVDTDSGLSFEEAQAAAMNLLTNTVDALGLEQRSDVRTLTSNTNCEPTDLLAAEYAVNLNAPVEKAEEYAEAIRRIWREAGLSGFVSEDFETFEVLSAESRDVYAEATIPHHPEVALELMVITDCYPAG